MQERGGHPLQDAERLLWEGKKQAALQSLAAYLKSNPGSSQAWWLLSQAVTDNKQQIECLERVLRLNPGHAQAQARLSKLKWIHSQQTIQPPVAPFTVSLEEEAAYKPEAKGSLHESTPNLSPEAREANKQPSETTGPLTPGSAPVKKPAPRKKKMNLVEMSVLAVLLCLLTASVGTLGALGLRQKMANDLQATQVMAQAWTEHPPMTLPPTWTSTLTPTLLPTRTSAPTETPSPTIVLSMPATNTHALSGWVSVPLEQSAPSAPNFTLKDVASGNQVSLSDFRGRPVVLVFWATWCGYCEREMSALKTVYNDYQDHGLVILAINAGESASDVRSYRKSHNLPFNCLLDPKRSSLKSYKVTAFPTNVFIDRGGRAVFSVVGMMDTAGLKGKILPLLPK
jgi:peroxiredoxin